MHQRSAERAKALSAALEEANAFFDACADLLRWMDEQRRWLKERETERNGTGERIREMLEEHRTFVGRMERRADAVEETRTRGKALEEHAPPGEKRTVEERNEELGGRWEEMGRAVVRRQHSLEVKCGRINNDLMM